MILTLYSIGKLGNFLYFRYQMMEKENFATLKRVI